MHKKALLFIIIIFTAWQSHAQIDSFPGIKDVLKQGSIAALKEYIDLTKKGDCNPDEWGMGNYMLSHEITPHFHESTLILFKCSIMGPSTIRTNSIVVNYLSYDSTILYAALDPGSESSVYTTTINPSLYLQLLQSYRETYGVELNTDELFTDGVLGIGGCGYGAIPPDGYLVIEKLIKRKDITKLQKQLRSANIVNQLYAVYAFGQLEKEGYEPDTETQRIINYIKAKEGTVEMCSGCLFDTKKITDFIKWLD